MPKQRTYEPGTRYHDNAVGRVTISATVPLDVRYRLENAATETGETMTAVLIAALNSYTNEGERAA